MIKPMPKGYTPEQMLLHAMAQPDEWWVIHEEHHKRPYSTGETAWICLALRCLGGSIHVYSHTQDDVDRTNPSPDDPLETIKEELRFWKLLPTE